MPSFIVETSPNVTPLRISLTARDCDRWILDVKIFRENNSVKEYRTRIISRPLAVYSFSSACFADYSYVPRFITHLNESMHL